MHMHRKGDATGSTYKKLSKYWDKYLYYIHIVVSGLGVCAHAMYVYNRTHNTGFIQNVGQCFMKKKSGTK